MTENGRPDVEGASVGQLIGEVTKDLSTLMRQELELAKVEIKAEAKKAGQGAGMFGAAGFAGYMVLMFLSFALWWALENVMDTGLATLVVAVLWGVIGAVTFVLGRKSSSRSSQARAHRRDPPAGSQRPQAQLTPDSTPGVAAMTSSDPDVIRRQIEETRRELSYDVDALNEKVNPARVVDRRVSAAKGRMTNLKEKVMGSAQDTTSSAHGMASDAAGSVHNAASSAPAPSRTPPPRPSARCSRPRTPSSARPRATPWPPG